jgi:hypothetical protein
MPFGRTMSFGRTPEGPNSIVDANRLTARIAEVGRACHSNIFHKARRTESTSNEQQHKHDAHQKVTAAQRELSLARQERRTAAGPAAFFATPLAVWWMHRTASVATFSQTDRHEEDSAAA